MTPTTFTDKLLTLVQLSEGYYQSLYRLSSVVDEQRANSNSKEIANILTECDRSLCSMYSKLGELIKYHHSV